MFFTNLTFIGVDPTAGEKPLVYVAIDHDLRLLAISEGSLDDVLAFAGGQKQAVVAVCGPRRPNQGLLKLSERREQLTPPPAPGRWENFRVVEYLLRLHNLFIPPTLDDPTQCPKWMQQSFLLFSRLMEMGYEVYPSPESERCCLEVYPHAAYSVLLGMLPFPKSSLEGRLQRQLILHECDMKIPDPMKFFEEITRHRLLKGVLPLEAVFLSAELDALVAAYCAWLTASKPGALTVIGDPEEGQVLLPAAEIKHHYLQATFHAKASR